MATPGGLVDKQELIDAQLDTAHLGRVVNSKDASGAPISTSTNRTGGVNKTLDALEAEYEQSGEDLFNQFETTFNSQFTYKRIGNISDYAGQSLPEAGKLNSYRYPDDSGAWYAPIQGQTFPITIPTDPTVSGSGWVLVNALSNDWGDIQNGTQVKHRRGTAAEISAGTPAIGELWFNTTDNTIHMGDGVTPGGNKHVNINTAHLIYLGFGILPTPGVDNSAKITEVANSQDLKLSRDVEFESDQIAPAGRFVLDGGGATIKNISDNTPVVYDDSAVVQNDTFKLSNLNLELDKNNVTPGNLAGGGVWLGLRNQAFKIWKRVEIENVNINEAFRVSINIQGSQHISIKNVHDTDSGLNTGNPVLFGYGAVFEDCVGIDVTDYSMRDAYGFGMHIIKSANFDGANISFDGLTFDGGTAIGLTITESDNVNIRNYNSRSDGDATEINASTNICIENFTWTSTGSRRGLLVGDNNTGVDNQNITLRNGFVNTTSGAFSAAINYAINLTMNHVVFNAPISFIANDTRSRRVRWDYCNINDSINSTYLKPYMFYSDTTFIDCILSKTKNLVEFTNVDTNQLLEINEYITIPLGAMGGLEEAFSFDIITSAYFTGAQKNQAGWKKYRVVFDTDGSGGVTGVSITLIDTWGAQTGRYLELQVVGSELRAVNTSGVQVRGNYKAKGLI